MANEEDSKNIDDLHAAVQRFSNAISDTPEESALVGQALVVWEETHFHDNDPTPCRQIMYSATGDGATPAGALGLAVYALEQLKIDLVGGHEAGDDDG